MAMQVVLEMRRPRDIARNPWILTGMLAIATLLLIVARPWMGGMPPIPFSMRASERQGELILRWDSGHPAVERADAAIVAIKEDGNMIQQWLTSEALRSGSFSYPRKSNDVVATLTLLRNEQPIASSLVRSIGPQ